MIKTRLIPVLFIKNGLIVRSEDFSYHQNIGNVINEAQRYNDWDVDELIYLDISRENFYDLRRDDHKIKSYQTIEQIIKEISRVCFMPLTFGGGIRKIEDVDLRIQNGADKVTLNTGAFDNRNLVSRVAHKYGSQAMVISIDYRVLDSQPIVFTESGQKNTQVKLLDWIAECQRQGAGEIFLNSIDRDGRAVGYDLDTIKLVTQATSLPVIACGGAGDIDDMVDLAKQTSVSAIAAGNIFHFTERSYPRAKKRLKEKGVNVR